MRHKHDVVVFPRRRRSIEHLAPDVVRLNGRANAVAVEPVPEIVDGPIVGGDIRGDRRDRQKPEQHAEIKPALGGIG